MLKKTTFVGISSVPCLPAYSLQKALGISFILAFVPVCCHYLMQLVSVSPRDSLRLCNGKAK